MGLKNSSVLTDLLVSAQGGNQKDYALFLKEVADMLRPYLLKRLEPDKVEDVLQESLFAIHQARHTYLPTRSIEPWIFAICHHRLIDYFRKFRRIEKHEKIDLEFLDRAVADEFVVEHHRAESVYQLLERLPDQQREVINLLKLQDFSVKEVSRKMNISESAVKVTAFRGYETIRRWLRIEKNEN